MPGRLSAGACLLVVVALGVGHLDSRAQTPRPPAVRLAPILVVLDAFESHRVVAMGEGPHGNQQGHAFRLSLIRNPRFSALVNDIVIESGSSRYQDDIDRFVRGEEVADVFLRAARENTVVPTPVWDRVIYDELFRVVRDVNRALPPDRQLRVLLGDPPIVWSELKTADDYRPWLLRRDSHPAEVIQREVLAKGRRALVVYGDGHLQARGERPGRSLVGILETGGTNVFNITTTFSDLSRFQSDVTTWVLPGLARLKGTSIGAAPYEAFFGPPPPVEFFTANPTIEDHFDAVLVLGSPSAMTLAPLEYPHCAEPDYQRMRLARMKLAGVTADTQRLGKDCAAAATAAPPR